MQLKDNTTVSELFQRLILTWHSILQKWEVTELSYYNYGSVYGLELDFFYLFIFMTSTIVEELGDLFLSVYT